MSPAGLGIKNDYAREYQQKLTRQKQSQVLPGLTSDSVWIMQSGL
jgi:hypothetical protein